jgi:MazG family protein
MRRMPPPPEDRPRAFEPPSTTGDSRLDAFARLIAIVERLRAPDGCPWDREQTVDTMAPSLIEEAHEAVEAIETGNGEGAVEELGDLSMVVALVAQIAAEEERFDFGTVLRAVGDKLIRRHPHVFAEVEVEGSEQAVANWEKIKQGERREKAIDASALAGVPKALPALQRAQRMSSKAIAAGFKWNDADGAFRKVREELEELTEAWESGDPERIEAELGDLLMATAFFAQYADLDPERAMRAALRRFEARFRAMEANLGAKLGSAPLDELMAAWEAAKRQLEAEA